jgi:hypothetical protein
MKTCSTNLVDESSGLKAHNTLAPQKARYASKQITWGGRVNLTSRERFCTIKTTEIATKAGQNILFSGRGVIMLCNLAATDVPRKGGGMRTANNGDTIMS